MSSCEATGPCSVASSSTARITWYPGRTGVFSSGRRRNSWASTPGLSLRHHRLLSKAVSLCPGLAEAEVGKTWAGLRPGSLDSRPYLGPIPQYTNAFVAAGRRRVGLQLSPATAGTGRSRSGSQAPGRDLTAYHRPRAGRSRRRGISILRRRTHSLSGWWGGRQGTLSVGRR
ncbi:MAG: FAD-dependent oxidoreductase [Isosphaeraceae bacterium]